MLKSFNLRQAAAVMSKHGMNAMPRIGRGLFSAVFDAGDYVVKLTSDLIAREYLQFGEGLIHIPVMHDWYREELPNGLPVDVILMEKLDKVQTHPDVRKQAKKLISVINRLHSEHRCDDRKALSKLVEHVEQAGDEDMTDAVLYLERIAFDYGDAVSLDFHLNNLMRRGDTLVFSDPFADHKYLRRQRHRMCGGYLI